MAVRLALAAALLVAALLAAPGGAALAQQRQAPQRAAPPPSGQPTLQPEPGDIWADVRAWNEDARRRTGRGAAPALGEVQPPAPRRPTVRKPRPAPAARIPD